MPTYLVSSISTPLVAVPVLLLIVVVDIVPVAMATTHILVAIVLVVQVVGFLRGLALCLFFVKVVHSLCLSQSIHLQAKTQVRLRL